MSAATACGLAIAALLVLLAVIDLRVRRLPQPLAAALAALALLHGVLLAEVPAVPWGGLAAGLLVALPFWLLRRLAGRRGAAGTTKIGGGDVRLAFAVGCLLGPGGGLLAAAIGTGGVALAGIAARLAGRRQPALPLGPFLAAAVLLLWN